MRRLTLDTLDLRILNALARDGRISYRRIGSAMGLTTKSVKARVDKMLSSRVIDKFITAVNPSIFGYDRTFVVALKKSKLTKELLERINAVGVIGYRFDVLGGVTGFGIGVMEGDVGKIQRLLDALRGANVGLIESRNYRVKDALTETDYVIIRQLIKTPRMEITDISKATSISSKTVRKRMEKLTKGRVLEFSISVNPAAMKGQIVYFLSVRADKQFYPKLLEKILGELHESIILSFNFSNQIDAIGLNLASEDVFKIESIRSRIESFNGVQDASVFFPIRLDYPQEWMIGLIDMRLQSSFNQGAPKLSYCLPRKSRQTPPSTELTSLCRRREERRQRLE